MKNNDRNLNITISKPEENKNEVIVSVSTVLKKLRKYLLIWIVAAVIFFVAAFGYATVTTHVSKPELVALISFSYDGIEKGLDPKGRNFDVNTVKNPAVIESALDDLGMDMKQLESVRQGIRIEGLKPKNAVDRITLYEKVLETNGSVNAVEKILDTTYFPTQYKVYFDYNNTTLTDSEAVEVFNNVLEQYQDYFYKAYGYNESLGSAVSAIDYKEYDYSEAVDVFQNSLDTLSKYVRQLSKEDTTRFRSSETGYTFDDLYEAIRTVEDINLDKISSYVIVNNLTRDKDQALAYYEYRIKDLTRLKTQYEEQIAAYDSSIASYQKDQIIIFGNGTDDTNTQSTVASEQYDKMIQAKNDTIANLAQAKRRISFYKERQEALMNKPVGTNVQTEKLEEELKTLDEKITELVDLVNKTSDDYYRNVTFKNAYNVLVPATNTTSDKVSHIIENAKNPLVLLEGAAFGVFFMYAFIEALIADSRKRKQMLAAAEDAEENSGDGDGDDDIEKPETETEKKEEKASSEKKETSSDNRRNRKKK